MSHVEANSSHRQEGTPLIHNLGHAKCPCCGFATIYEGQEPPQYVDTELLQRIRTRLIWHKSDKATRLLVQEIDVILLSR